MSSFFFSSSSYFFYFTLFTRFVLISPKRGISANAFLFLSRLRRILLTFSKKGVSQYSFLYSFSWAVLSRRFLFISVKTGQFRVSRLFRVASLRFHCCSFQISWTYQSGSWTPGFVFRTRFANISLLLSAKLSTRLEIYLINPFFFPFPPF